MRKNENEARQRAETLYQELRTIIDGNEMRDKLDEWLAAELESREWQRLQREYQGA